jgi:hypothetical protein
MRVLDAPIIDYGFQPIVNRTMRHPADLALTSGLGGAVMGTTGALLMVIAHLDVPVLVTLAMVAIASQGATLASAVGLYRLNHFMLKPGCPNILRYIMAWPRLGMVILAVLVSLSDCALGTRWDVSILMVMGNALWMATLYFGSCDLPPPRPQRVPPRVKPTPILAAEMAHSGSSAGAFTVPGASGPGFSRA